jgi:HD-like signal output (HDOD) protein
MTSCRVSGRFNAITINLAVAIVKRIGRSVEHLDGVRIAGLIHNIGMMGILLAFPREQSVEKYCRRVARQTLPRRV